ARKLVIDGEGINHFHETALLPDGSGFVCHCNSYYFSEGTIWLLRWKPSAPLRKVWKVKPRGLTARSPGLHPQVIRVSPTGKTFLALDAKYGQGYWTPQVELVRVGVWSVADGKMLSAAELPAGTARALALAPAGHTFVTCQTSALSVWDVNDLKAAPRRIQ